MFILTLSSHNDNDGTIQDLVGIFPDMEAIRKYIVDDFGEPAFEKYKAIWDKERKAVTTFDEIKNGETKPGGLKCIFVSQGYLDNGYGGRYYEVWEMP